MNKNYALITGSTAGIGLDIAQELASRGHNILLTARREDRLKDIAEQLTTDFGVDAHYVVADLGEVDAPGIIFDFCASNNYIVDILVNNAGYTINKEFHEISEEEEERFSKPLPPRIGQIRTTISRVKSGFSMLWPKYTLNLSDSNKFLLAGKKKSGSATSKYVISSN